MISEGFTISQMKEIVDLLGFNRTVKAWSQILRNPFYAGTIRHSLLKDTVEGKHPPIITKELFAKVQGVLSGNNKGSHKIDEFYPLKRVVYCEHCGKPLSAYLVKKKNKHYYKCPTVGCGNNVSMTHYKREIVQPI